LSHPFIPLFLITTGSIPRRLRRGGSLSSKTQFDFENRRGLTPLFSFHSFHCLPNESAEKALFKVFTTDPKFF
jgi:hypothetical protein